MGTVAQKCSGSETFLRKIRLQNTVLKLIQYSDKPSAYQDVAGEVVFREGQTYPSPLSISIYLISKLLFASNQLSIFIIFLFYDTCLRAICNHG